MTPLIAFTIDLTIVIEMTRPPATLRGPAHRDPLQQTCQTDAVVGRLGLYDRDRSQTPLEDSGKPWRQD
jgi:hypothetical protein